MKLQRGVQSSGNINIPNENIFNFRIQLIYVASFYNLLTARNIVAKNELKSHIVFFGFKPNN